MLTEARIVYLIVYVNDLAISRDFYERTLGFRVIEADSDSVKYDGGHVMLLLNRAQDYGITLTQGRDHSADMVFLVEDLDRSRAALERKGVQFTPTVRYEIGAIADLYDPDGHWLTLYEPSEEAMSWPSGAKIQAIMKARELDRSRYGRTSASMPAEPEAEEFRMDGKELIYLFFFVRDADETLSFYNLTLGLRDLEGGPCSSGSTGDEEGVIKYDAGGFLFTTHYTDLTGSSPPPEVDEHICPPRIFDPKYAKGVAPVFHVTSLEEVVKELAQAGIPFIGGISRSQIGTIARFEDPSGHPFFLYEPSAEALAVPSGAKIRQILAAPLDVEEDRVKHLA